MMNFFGFGVGEWLAFNTVEFFMLTNLFYDVVSSECITNSKHGKCEVMRAGKEEFWWTDTQRRAVRLSAPHYVDYVLSQVQSVLSDETLFPTKMGVPFPQREFIPTLRIVYLQLFRVLAHIMWNHYQILVDLTLEAH
ncbi:hypothetical protein BB560_006655, partial [Smittium megazygosporum]